MQISILNLRENPGSGAVRGYADVCLAGKLTIFGCKIIQQEGQRPYLKGPDRPYPGPDGKTRYTPVINFDDETLKNAVQQAVLTAWEQQKREIHE